MSDGRLVNAHSSWRQLLDQHLKILSDHLGLWSTIKSEKKPGTNDHGTAQTCLDNTQTMIQNFQNLQMSFSKASAESKSVRHKPVTGVNSNVPPAPSNRPAKHQRSEIDSLPSTSVKETKPVKDISDLFTIDTNPTPVEHFQTSKAGKRAEKNLKRKLSQSKLHPIGLSEPLQEVVQPPKRSKRESAPGTIRTEDDSRPVDSKENIEDDDDNDSFVAKVQQKHQEKESKRQKKLDKKRKRESNTSLEEHAAAATKLNKPVKKKPKQGSANPTQTSDSNTVGPKRPATDANSQTGFNGAQSKKRRKTSK